MKSLSKGSLELLPCDSLSVEVSWYVFSWFRRADLGSWLFWSSEQGDEFRRSRVFVEALYEV